MPTQYFPTSIDRLSPLAALLAVIAVAGLLWSIPPDAPMTGHGNPSALRETYRAWKAGYEKRANPQVLDLALRHSKALSARYTDASGRLALDLLNGNVAARIAGLRNDRAYELWLLGEQRHDGTAARLKLGTFSGRDSGLALDTQIDAERAGDFVLESAVVVEAGTDPRQAGLLFATPGLFQRLYYADQPYTVAAIGDPLSAVAALDQPSPFAALLPAPAFASTRNVGDPGKALEAQIAEGRRLFTQETFGGNGRTCATCHRPDNNHTIDPAYIAKLPDDDPLFIAERDPALAELEKPELLRQFGLVLVNADGFDNPSVMRGVPHTLALATSICVETVDTEKVKQPSPCTGKIGKVGDFFTDEDFAHAVGWSGDGAPDDGSLRMFSKGAVVQHMTKSLERQEGIDFRLPTEAELDALEAYMLSLGRSTEVDLSKLTFRSAFVQRGKALFDTKENPVDANGNPIFGTTANCNGCHQNAGANSSTTQRNPTRDTGVEAMHDAPAMVADPSLAHDGGFGTDSRSTCGPERNAPCFGDGRFNSTALIEAADTAPFFHNNSVPTIEEAVAFYNTDAFNASPGSRTSSGKNREVKISSAQVAAVALFLRSINALENLRSATQLNERSMALNLRNGRESIRLAMADTHDAIEVLSGAVYRVYPGALRKIRQAYALEERAAEQFFPARRNDLLRKANALHAEARDLMVEIAP